MIATVNHTVASLRTVVQDMSKKHTHLEDKYVKMKRNDDNLVNDVAMLKKQSPGTPLSKSQKRRKNRRATSEAEEEEDDSE
eukprot:scaffold463_cov46-Attheya_sp.AAC.2